MTPKVFQTSEVSSVSSTTPGLPAPLDFHVTASFDNRDGRILIAYLGVRSGDVARTDEIADGSVNADYDADGNLLGVELYGACTMKPWTGRPRRNPPVCAPTCATPFHSDSWPRRPPDENERRCRRLHRPGLLVGTSLTVAKQLLAATIVLASFGHAAADLT